MSKTSNGKAGRQLRVQRVVSTRATNELIAKEITERVAKRVQELEGRYGTTASFNMKAAIFDEVLPVLENGVEC